MEPAENPSASLQELWHARKAELDGFVSKNIYKFFFTNSLFSFVFLGGTCLALNIRFPVSKYLLFLAGYFTLAITVFRADFLVEAGNPKSEKRRYLALMLWPNLFFLILGLSFSLLAVATWRIFEVSDFIRLVSMPILFFILIYLFWWLPRKFSRDIYIGKRRSQAKYGNYLGIVGLAVLLLRWILHLLHLDWIVLLSIFFIASIIAFLISFQAIYQNWIDGLLIANDFLD